MANVLSLCDLMNMNSPQFNAGRGIGNNWFEFDCHFSFSKKNADFHII